MPAPAPCATATRGGPRPCCSRPASRPPAIRSHCATSPSSSCTPAARRRPLPPCSAPWRWRRTTPSCTATSGPRCRPADGATRPWPAGGAPARWIRRSPRPGSTWVATCSRTATPKAPSTRWKRPSRRHPTCCPRWYCWAMPSSTPVVSMTPPHATARRWRCTQPAATPGAGCPTSRRCRWGPPMGWPCARSCDAATWHPATAWRWAMRWASWKRTAATSRPPTRPSAMPMPCRRSSRPGARRRSSASSMPRWRPPPRCRPPRSDAGP